MSLKVWLPLNGNLENRGASDITVSNAGAAVDNNGKVGKCYSFDGTDDIITISNASNTIRGGSNPFSFAMWIYNNENGTRGEILSTYDGNAANMSFELNSGSVTSNLFRFWWNGEADYYIGTLQYQAWTHLAVTYNGSLISVYINGILIDSKTKTLTQLSKSTFYLGNDKRSGGNPFKGKMNDVRIYDHCLSQEEVREIAKGLVLHYPLNRVGGVSGNANMLYNSSSGIGRNGLTLDTDGTYIGVTNGTGGWNELYPEMNPRNTITTASIVGKVFTISGYVKWNNISSINNCYIGYGGFPASGPRTYDINIPITDYKIVENDLPVNSNNIKANTWYHVYCTITIPSSWTASSVYFRLQIKTNSGVPVGNIFYYKRLKVESGSVATDWCPNSSDAMYSALGYNDTTVYDCSGYGYNGTATGTFTSSTNTPRYEASTNFSKSAARYINAGDMTFLQQFTWSCWVYQTDRTTVHGTGTQTTQYILSQGRDYRESGSYSYGFNLTSYNGQLGISAINTVVGTGFTMNLNQWYHIVATYDGSTIKVYANGELKYSKADSIATLWYYGKTFIIGKMSHSYSSTDYYYPFVGSISDVRIYATALSADDIKLLYSRGASIDNTGKLHCGEITEGKSKIQVEKSTEVNCSDIDEVSRTKAQFYKSGKIGTTHLIES